LRIFIIIKIMKESPEQLKKEDNDEKKSNKAIKYLFSETPYRNRIEKLKDSEIQGKKNKRNDDLDFEKKIIQKSKTKKAKITKSTESPK
jgi:hypothetical protein